jgi:DNA processing protein
MALYVKGQIKPEDKRSIAIVGSRHTTHYGLETSKKLGYQLAYAGVTVVSGLARGIDTAAHQGALAAKGRTIAVLGCGINVVYPPENKSLYDKIVESGGAVVSEYPFHSPPDAQNFAIRNRVISGLSLGCVVVEAAASSGAMITVKWAEEQGRPVFAVPGRIDSPPSKGCHKLIKEGAKLVEDAEDILSEFEYLQPLGDQAKGSTGVDPAGIRTASILTEIEAKVYATVGRDETEIDDIIQKSDLTSAHVSATLLALEMKKQIKQLPGNRFVRLG